MEVGQILGALTHRSTIAVLIEMRVIREVLSSDQQNRSYMDSALNTMRRIISSRVSRKRGIIDIEILQNQNLRYPVCKQVLVASTYLRDLLGGKLVYIVNRD